jgi:putative hydrolase of HD superfamily
VAGIEALMMQMLQAATTLKRLPRSGWLFAGVAQPESVADHSWATALLALALAATVNHDPAAHGLAAPLDAGRVAQIAVVHDLAESVVTDLPRRATQLLGKDVKHQAEALALEQLARDLPNSDFLALWYEYCELSTPEGRIVHDADKLEMVHQALVYERAGNQNLGEFWQEYQWHYRASEEIYAALVNARSNHVQPIAGDWATV